MLQLDKNTFKETIKNGIVAVDFWAVWCGPCRMMAPIFEQVAEELGGKSILAKLNIDENMIIAQQYNVMSIPTIIIFKEGQEIERIIGLRQKTQLLDIIKKHI
ncbi:MAG: thioredoxin [Clostridia bacterium]|jgi:thioredoxin 1|nr:thioredoxin [Clostridia bacterium]